MIKDIQNIEDEFCNRIDCNFPYSNIYDCKGLIDEALSISDNAVFTVIEEIARIPVSEKSKISNADLKSLLEIIKSRFEHPLMDDIYNVTLLMIDGKEITVNESLLLMNKIEDYNGLWGALSIAYFSSDDVDGFLDVKFDSIRAKWNRTQP